MRLKASSVAVGSGVACTEVGVGRPGGPGGPPATPGSHCDPVGGPAGQTQAATVTIAK